MARREYKTNGTHSTVRAGCMNLRSVFHRTCFRYLSLAGMNLLRRDFLVNQLAGINLPKITSGNLR